MCWRIQLKGERAAGATILHPAVRRALKLLTENDEDQSLDELAKACGAKQVLFEQDVSPADWHTFEPVPGIHCGCAVFSMSIGSRIKKRSQKPFMLLASGVTPNSTKYSPKFMDVVPETHGIQTAISASASTIPVPRLP